MNQSPRDLRRAAQQAFQNSLDQLQETLEVPVSQTVESDMPEPPQRRDRQPPKSSSINLADLEAAVADIEEFIRAQQEDGDGRV